MRGEARSTISGCCGLELPAIFKCPARRIVAFYDQHVSDRHLEVGPGTGYFLDRCRFPVATPEIHLLDLNPDCLEKASRRLQQISPDHALLQRAGADPGAAPPLRLHRHRKSSPPPSRNHPREGGRAAKPQAFLARRRHLLRRDGARRGGSTGRGRSTVGRTASTTGSRSSATSTTTPSI